MTQTTPDYIWDVFVSYKREPDGVNLITPWIREVVERVELWLRQELRGRPIRVFLDTDSIEIGSHWPDRLRHAILTSRCLVPILSPEYFQSRWCLTEWSSFRARERLIRPPCESLIVPMKFHDGQWFPPEAQQIRTLDLSRHAGTTPAFWATKRADELDQMLVPFAQRVAEVISQVPPFSAEWPIHEGVAADAPDRFPMPRL